MGTTLTGTTPQDTYDSLIKVTDNGPISATAKYLSDGLGNDSVLALSTTAVGIGTNAPTAGAKLTLSGTSSSAYIARIVQTNTTSSDSFGLFLAAGTDNSDSAFRVQNAVQNANLFTIQGAGNVGIGTSSPEALLHINKSTAGGEGGYIYLDNPSASTIASNAGIKFATSSGASFASIYTGLIQNIITNAGDGASALVFGTFDGSTSAERVRILAGGGITFNGDTAAANALDDYEEGTFTATLKGGTTDPTTPVTSTGTYTKIGRQVTVRGEFVNVDTTGASGVVSITGLPFTSASQTTGSVMLFNFDLDTSTAQNSYIGASSLILEFYGQKDDAAWVPLKHNAGSGRYMIFTHTYFV